MLADFFIMEEREGEWSPTERKIHIDFDDEDYARTRESILRAAIYEGILSPSTDTGSLFLDPTNPKMDDHYIYFYDSTFCEKLGILANPVLIASGKAKIKTLKKAGTRRNTWLNIEPIQPVRLEAPTFVEDDNDEADQQEDDETDEEDDGEEDL